MRYGGQAEPANRDREPATHSVIPYIPVFDSYANTGDSAQPFLQRLGDSDRTMTAARASYANGQVRLSFADVLRHQKFQQVQRVLEELVRRFGAIEILEHLRVAAGMRPELRDEVWIRQEPDVEQQVRIHRNAVLEAEAEDRDDKLC